MPIPTPTKGESKSAFVSRCVESIGSEFDTPEQAIAVCYSKWDETKSRKSMSTETHGTFGIVTDDELDDEFANANEILLKADDEDKGYTLVTGPVLVPESVDRQGDIISAEEITKAAHDYAEDSQRAGLMHSIMLGTKKVPMVESYVAPQQLTIGGKRVKKGTWLISFRVYDDKLRKMIRDGKLTGFSIGGRSAVEQISED